MPTPGPALTLSLEQITTLYAMTQNAIDDIVYDEDGRENRLDARDNASIRELRELQAELGKPEVLAERERQHQAMLAAFKRSPYEGGGRTHRDVVTCQQMRG